VLLGSVCGIYRHVFAFLHIAQELCDCNRYCGLFTLRTQRTFSGSTKLCCQASLSSTRQPLQVCYSSFTPGPAWSRPFLLTCVVARAAPWSIGVACVQACVLVTGGFASFYGELEDDRYYIKFEDDIMFIKRGTIEAMLHEKLQNRYWMVSANVINHPSRRPVFCRQLHMNLSHICYRVFSCSCCHHSVSAAKKMCPVGRVQPMCILL